jgi:hypothetical protein
MTANHLEPERGGDAELVDRLTAIVNDVYATAESGLWRKGATRTTASELAALIEARQIVVATRHADIFGLMRLHDAWSHPSKEFLKGWYCRRGYRLVRTRRIDDAYRIWRRCSPPHATSRSTRSRLAARAA